MSRRWKRVMISEEFLLDIFNINRNEPATIDGTLFRGIRFEGIPTNAKIERVSHDHYRCCFVLAISHESFDEIHEGQPIPKLEVAATMLTSVS